MPHSRLVSFLGLGRDDRPPSYYQPTRYSLDGATSTETPLVQAAIAELIPEVATTVVLGTKEVADRWFAADMPLYDSYARTPRVLWSVPGELGEGEARLLFETVVRALDHRPLGDLGEVERPSEIILDVTCGFRAQPLLGMAAVAFVLSEWARQEVPHPPRLRVLYGAFESRERHGGVAPIWDLTDFVAVSRWNAALDAFLRFGRADDLERLGRLEANARVQRARAADVEPSLLAHERFAAPLGRAARELADDLALGRLRDLLTRSAPQLRRLVTGEAAVRLRKQLPVLGPALDQLGRRLEPLCATGVLTWDGLRATAALLDVQRRLQRFLELSATLREALVTHYALTTGLSLADPGMVECETLRGRAEAALTHACRVVRDSACTAEPPVEPRLTENLRISNAIHQVRNDVQHCGLKNQPQPAASLRSQLERESRAFEKLADEGPAPEPHKGEERAERLFLNISNHPSASWAAPQRAAAAALAPRIVDVPFPEVPPEEGTEDLAGVIDTVLDSLPAGATHAMVSGEYVTTTLVVQQLQRRGVTCVAATTRRVVEEQPDGLKKSRFVFVRFREYPLLG
jgi:hypothetical protein